MIRQLDLISPAYVEMQKVLHAAPQGYGGRGRKWAPTVLWLLKWLDAHSVLDYGCGQGSLGDTLRAAGVACRDYDPAIPGKDGRPGFADLVVCTDVLEHVEPDRLTAVLNHLQLLARKAIFLVVNLRESNKTLTDGRNAHLIIKPAPWWEAKIADCGMFLQSCPDLPVPDGLRVPDKAAKFWYGVVRP